ncbi:MAG: hypothetical protein ABIP35_05870, partial [Ginsengibacter sp.]
MKFLQLNFLKGNRMWNLFSILFVFSTLFFQACNKKEKLISVDPAFSQYIDGYTSGIISKTSSIKIKLASEASTTHALGEVVDKS